MTRALASASCSDRLAGGLHGILALLLLSGCTVGPDFKPPAAPSTARYTSPGETLVGESDAGPGSPPQTLALGEKVAVDWWTLFQSPDLDAVVKQAIDGSRTLEGAKARLTQAREAIAAASSALYPQVAAGAGVDRQKVSATQFGLPPSAFPLPPNFNLFQVGATVGYSIDVFGATRRDARSRRNPLWPSSSGTSSMRHIGR